MKEMMKKEIKNRRRGQVLQLLKDGAYEQLTEQEIPDICRELVALRDQKIVAELAKKLDLFTPEMLALNLDNWNDCKFIDYILNKYQKKFDWQDEEVCDKLFELACIVQNKKTVLFLMKQSKAVSQYPKLAASSDEMFALLSKLKLLELSNDQVVDIIVNATLSGKENTRLRVLRDKKFDWSTENAKGQTAAKVVEAQIENTKYSKNKSGNLKKTHDMNALQFLKKMEQGLIVDEPKKIEWKKASLLLAAAAVVVALACGLAISQSNSKDDSDTESNSDDTAASYNTDTSLVVENGDTVNIDYIGYVDDVAFDGGNTNGEGTSLTIGSGSYIDDFEEQLIGHNVGDSVTVNVTFPEDYGNEELNGKEARFEVTINGIYE